MISDHVPGMKKVGRPAFDHRLAIVSIENGGDPVVAIPLGRQGGFDVFIYRLEGKLVAMAKASLWDHRRISYYIT